VTSPANGFVNAFGGRYYRIARAEELPPFFVNLVSASDLWMFISSNGALTAGRGDSDHACFPYQTVDRIHDSAGVAGPVSSIVVATAQGEVAWDPFAPHTPRLHEVGRSLYKSVEGDRIWFEERHEGLGLVFRYGWSTADEHGFIRTCELENLRDEPCRLRLLDGLRNLLPPGIILRLLNTASNLTDAYKTAEVVPGTTLAVYSLSAGITDHPVAMESLRATTVWSEGLPGARLLLSDPAAEEFLAGRLPAAETRRRGLRCSYYLCAPLELAPRQTVRWVMAVDTGLGQAEVVACRRRLESGPQAAIVQAAADAATLRLRALVGAADGLQAGGDETVTAHHFANTLFNILRGGVFADGHRVAAADFSAFVGQHNPACAARHAGLFAALPANLSRADLLARCAAAGDPALLRLAEEYLPLLFSRRHGDPSRPWNRFSIRLRDEHDRPLLAYEGNWRDIFQNWEALCLSHPGFLNAAVAKFLNTSTADGHNPYRVTQSGFEWEVPEPENPWASIGYWGDHQVVYLLKLLEWSDRCEPRALRAALRQPRYSYALVPYRIASYAQMRRDPRATITFDTARHREIMQRVEASGADAKLAAAPDGGVLHVNLTEKLLVSLLARLVNFVPGGGLWMNTQRPEWNDANNALVGHGVSLVTLCYLRRLAAHVRTTLLPALGDGDVAVSSAVADLAAAVGAVLRAHVQATETVTTEPSARRAFFDALAQLGSDYRAKVYTEGPGAATAVPPAAITGLFDLALRFIDATIRANRRADGLYHSYNQLAFAEQPPALHVTHLQVMLEGQVAVLSSGLLTPAESVALLDAMRRSPLYRPDQRSYVLYPDRQLPGFLERNVIPAAVWAGCPLFAELAAAGDRRLVLVDAAGDRRFHPDLVNEAALESRLAQLGADARWAAAVAAQAPQVSAAYEQVFNHRAYTGRSGSMFGFEGLGCIYWHMVAKLLLAVQETLVAALDTGAPEVARLTEQYYDVRAGLGFNKTPAEYGAFPTDPYSHTPGHSGAQQPGMTGQVKEEILTRLGELGLRIDGGRVTFAPRFLRRSEFTAAPDRFRSIAADRTEQELALPAGALAFTFCGTPVVYRLTDGPARLQIHRTDGRTRTLDGTTLDAETSAALLARDGSIARIEAELGAGHRFL
jgi:hypothetical protein